MALFVVFEDFGVVCVGDGLGATKTRFFGKKRGGTPNPQVKKVGVTPNLIKFSRRPPLAAAEAGRGAKRRGRPEPRRAAADAKI